MVKSLLVPAFMPLAPVWFKAGVYEKIEEEEAEKKKAAEEGGAS